MWKIEQTHGAFPELVDEVLSRLGELGVHASWSFEETVDGIADYGALTIVTEAASTTFPALATPAVSANAVPASAPRHDAILLARLVTPAQAEVISTGRWSGYADTAGNASLRAPGLILEVSGKKGRRETQRLSTSAPFTRTGVPVTLALLSAGVDDPPLAQRDLAAMSGASLGTVNRVVRALRGRVPAMLDDENRLLRPETLEDEWVSAYSTLQRQAWQEERFRSAIWTTPEDLLDAQLPEGVLLGSEVAARSMGAPIRPAAALIHVPRAMRGEVIRLGRLRHDDDGMIRLRSAPWVTSPVRSGAIAPNPVVRADLLLEDDPRVDEVAQQLFGGAR